MANKTHADKHTDTTIQNTRTGTSKMLIHACCGPCSLEPVRLLQERGIFPVIYYTNSNIHPREEYERRLDTLQAWADEARADKTCADPALLAPVPVIEGTYDPVLWESTVDMSSREARCRTCYRLRFAECAEYAAVHGFDTIGTTLSVSPYQYTQIIREELERAATAHGLQAFFEDYTPYYTQATRRSRALGMYRQNYCGCRISESEAEAERAQRKQEREAAKQQKRAEKEQYAREHAQEIADAEQAREARKRERTAYNKKQARKKQILKQLRAQRTGQATQEPSEQQ